MGSSKSKSAKGGKGEGLKNRVSEEKRDTSPMERRSQQVAVDKERNRKEAEDRKKREDALKSLARARASYIRTSDRNIKGGSCRR